MDFLAPKGTHKPDLCVFVLIGTSASGISLTLGHLLEDVEKSERIKRLAFDSDATQNYPHRTEPLVSRIGAGPWEPNTFIPIPIPNQDISEAILSGERPGEFDNVPSSILQTLKNHDKVGVGGLVGLGDASGNLNQDRCREAVRNVFNQITDSRNVLYGRAEVPLVVYEIAGCLGGTWGALERIHEVIVDEADQMSITVIFHRIMIYPGVHASKDMVASMANAFAWTKEFAARSTGRYVQMRFDRVSNRPVRRLASVIPTWIVSDMSNSPGKPTTVDTPALFSMIAHWLRLVTATPFGSGLPATLVDFEDDALEVDDNGERRVARSFGLSFVTLDRERVARFGVQKLVRHSLEQLHGPVDPEQVDEEIRQFFHHHHLHEGAGFTDLSRILRSQDPQGQTRVDPVTRFRSLFEESIRHLRGIDLLKAAPNIFQTTVTQTADAAEQIRETRRGFVEQVERELDHYINHRLWDPDRGVAHIQAWLQEAKDTLEWMVGLAAEDRRQHVERIASLQHRVERLEEEAIPPFTTMNSSQRWFNRRHIHRLAHEYVLQAKALESARQEDLAREEAIAALKEIRAIFEDRHGCVSRLTEEMASAISSTRAEEERIRHWEGTLVNPKGVALDDDLDGLYTRILSRPEDEGQDQEEGAIESRAARELLLALQVRTDVLELVKGEGGIAATMESMAFERLRPAVLALHVQTELLRRDLDELKSLLSERDWEAFESVRLNGATDHDRAQVVRFLYADDYRADEILQVLNQAAYLRGMGTAHNAQYRLTRHPGDAEYLIFVHLRLSIYPAQISLSSGCRKNYVLKERDSTCLPIHTELVGRFLPEQGVQATPLDAQIALIKAMAIGALEPANGNGSEAFVYCAYEGAHEPVDGDLRLFRRFDVRVEVATRFYCDWREIGPNPLREQVLQLGALVDGDVPEASPLSRQAAEYLDKRAVEKVIEELEWYGRNTLPQVT